MGSNIGSFVIRMSFLLIAYCVLFSCEDYERIEGCHLDKMKINGNVVKIETIVQSTIPLTELFYNAYDPQSCISLYAGNISIDIDKHGNIERSIGYGIDGKILFDNKFTSAKDYTMTLGIPIGPEANQKINRIEIVTQTSGVIESVKYYDDDQLIWNQKAIYNFDGSIHSIIKEYETLKLKNDFYEIIYADTTTYEYLSFDYQNNWTEVKVDYVGILPRHMHTYNIKRQITYDEDDTKPELICELGSYNNTKTEMATSNTDKITLGQYGSIEIPHYMELQSKEKIDTVSSGTSSQFKYLFLSEYDNNNAYATFSVQVIFGEDKDGFDGMTHAELAYDKEFDGYLEEQNTEVLASNGVYILKWLPYEFTTVSGRRALKTHYYRYGIFSPLPVYFENYSVPMPDGNTLNFTYSFQSNLDNRFRKDFENAMNSISYYL